MLINRTKYESESKYKFLRAVRTNEAETFKTAAFLGTLLSWQVVTLRGRFNFKVTKYTSKDAK